MRTFWLFQATPDGLPRKRQGVFWVWNLGILLAAGLCLGWLSLFFAYGDYPDTIMKTYFQHPLILFLNIAPVVLALFLLYALMGRSWPAFLLADLVIWGLSLGNYYKLRFRDDPLMFQDLKNLRDAAAITAMADYDLTPDKRCVFGVLCLLSGTAFLFFLARGKLPKKPRLILLAVCAALCLPTAKLMENTDVYNSKTQNFDQIERWSSTQVYLSKGFVYPFLHSITAGAVKPPAGYSQAETRALLESCTPEDIPEEKKVDLIAIQLEAFADFSLFEGVEGIDFHRAYETYHRLEAESYTGNLVTNIFAGGTVDTERAFLTGFADQRNYRADTNSYAWYLRSQGYAAEGCHPSYEWFYNRRNVNGYLGLPVYYFIENRFRELYPHGEAPDEVLFPEIFRLYEENRDGTGNPYFSFNVTYQGHGPYGTEDVWRGHHFTDGRYSTETANIVDNYLGSVMDTANQLQRLFNRFRQESRPVVLLVFGDHKPWLGYGNSAYQELGVNLDLATEEGFYNYYSTRYLIWANDAAREIIGHDLQGDGPDISPCYLMNLVFQQLGWEGPAFMQAMEPMMETFPVVSTKGRYQVDGTLVESIPEERKDLFRQFLYMQYYWSREFIY